MKTSLKLTAAVLCALSLFAASCDDDDDNDGPDDGNTITTTRYAGSTSIMAADEHFKTADTMTVTPMGKTDMVNITLAARKLTIASAGNMEVSVSGFTIDSVEVKGTSNNMSRKNPFNATAKVGIGGSVSELTVNGKLESGMANGRNGVLSLADVKIGNMPVSISSFSFLGDKVD